MVVLVVVMVVVVVVLLLVVNQIFATFTFDNFLSSNAGSNVYDSLMLEGGRPLILHSHIHATK
ncbi:hypothetical protein WUBG_03495, partial [Wuchereria bancrofti]